MSTMPMPGGKNPLVLGGIVLAALWLYSRSAAARQGGGLPLLNRPVITPGRTQSLPYTTPTAVAGQLAAGVVGLLRGIATGPDKGIAVGNTTQRDALRAAERASDPGYYGWSGPVAGQVNGGAGDEGSAFPYVDGLPIGTVYDPSDYINNPSIGFWGIE